MGPSGFLFPQQVASNGPNQKKKKKKTNKKRWDKDGPAAHRERQIASRVDRFLSVHRL
jgi:hypothetical protein